MNSTRRFRLHFALPTPDTDVGHFLVFGRRNLAELEDRGVYGRLTLKWIIGKWFWGGGAWTRSILLRIGTGGGLL